MPEYLPSLTKEENAWLVGLMRDIWKSRKEPRTDSFGRKEPPMPPEISRKLKKSELEKLFALIRTRHLVCTLSGHGWFNGVALHVYDQASDADDEPRFLVSICHEHLMMKKEVFQRAFEMFTEIASTPTNLQFLEFYGLEKPKHRAHYEY